MRHLFNIIFVVLTTVYCLSAAADDADAAARYDNGHKLYVDGDYREAAKAFVVEGGYEPMYGARPLKRYLQKHVGSRRR